MTFDEKIQLWNAIGTWFAGISTFGAVVVSLYLSRQSSRIKLKATVGLRTIVTRGLPSEEVLQFEIANLGERPITVTNIGWVVGRGSARRYGVQLFGSPTSAAIPKALAHGERASFLVSFKDRPDWMEDFSEKIIKSNAPAVLASLRARIHTSVDQTVTIKPESYFLEQVGKAYREP